MDSFLLILVVLIAIVALWQAVKLGLRAIICLVRLGSVTAVLAPLSYAAAKAEAALSTRDLAFDMAGNRHDAKLFNAIVRDRLTRIRLVASHPDHATIATNLGRSLAISRTTSTMTTPT